MPCPAKRAEPGLETFTPCFAALCLPCSRTKPALFCPFSAEAVGLTGMSGFGPNKLFHFGTKTGYNRCKNLQFLCEK